MKYKRRKNEWRTKEVEPIKDNMAEVLRKQE